jgi:hypothetical protein
MSFTAFYSHKDNSAIFNTIKQQYHPFLKFHNFLLFLNFFKTLSKFLDSEAVFLDVCDPSMNEL